MFLLFRLQDIRDFNPRSPWGERPEKNAVLRKTLDISIHAPRGGSDSRSLASSIIRSYFNPRSPWGERRGCFPPSHPYSGFQSTLPVGGATRQTCHPAGVSPISIHAPRGGSDKNSVCPMPELSNFNPRSPWGERPQATMDANGVDKFQSTLPVGGATAFCFASHFLFFISIHAPRGGSDRRWA